MQAAIGVGAAVVTEDAVTRGLFVEHFRSFVAQAPAHCHFTLDCGERSSCIPLSQAMRPVILAPDSDCTLSIDVDVDGQGVQLQMVQVPDVEACPDVTFNPMCFHVVKSNPAA